MNILADASLPGLDAAFPDPFNLTRYHTCDELMDKLCEHNILVCRSTLKVNEALLKNTHINCVATASSGTDHIDLKYLKQQRIQLFDAKGSNANSVADYVMSCIAYSDQQHLLKGKKVGIIGMGQIGTKVYARLTALGFQLHTYDPLKAEQDSSFQSCELHDLFPCDLLCVHAQLHETQPYPSLNLIDNDFLSQLKPGCILINAARGGILNEEALLNTPIPLVYCTDVYLNEPEITKRIIDKATLCTPHIAGHNLEAKHAAVARVSEQIHRLAKLPHMLL